MHIVVSGPQRLGRLGSVVQIKALLALLALGLVASLGRAQVSIGSEGTGLHAGKTSSTRPALPFKLCRGYLIVVSGSVGGLEKLHFLIDTSASKSIADRRLVKRLGASQQPGTLYATGETISARQALLTDLHVGPLSTISLPVFALDLSSLEQTLGLRIDMLIGLDVLGQSSFSIDYQARRILFGEPPELPLEVPMQSGPPLVSVTVWLEGQPFRLLVNSGFPDLMLEGPNAKAAVQDVRIDQSRLAANAAGDRFIPKRVSIQSVRLGGVELGQQPAFIISEARTLFDGSLPIPGRFTEVAFDFKHHLLGLRK